MINKVSAVSFKNNSLKDEVLTPQEIKARVYQEEYKDGFPTEAEKTAFAVGGAVALGGSIAKKSINKGVGMGACAYLASLLISSGIQVKKNVDNGKEYAKKYGNVDIDNTKGFKKITQALTLPQPIDFGSDEKNKQYFEYQLNDNKKALAQSGLSILITTGVTLAYTGICALAKKTKHINKAPLVALGSMFASMITIPLAQYKMEQKANKINNENENKEELKPQVLIEETVEENKILSQESKTEEK